MSACAEPHRVALGVTLAFFDNPTSLIYGIGNAGRQDDGLGWAFIDRLEQMCPHPRARLRRTYQLGLEDADLTLIFQPDVGDGCVVTRKCPSCKGKS